MMATVKLARYKFVSKMLDKNDKIIDIDVVVDSQLFIIQIFVNKL